jgi:GDSL-like Lipase/Acylhydrolase family
MLKLYRLRITIFIAMILIACAADVGIYPEPVTATPVHVVYYGDSLVHQSGGRLQKLLPVGSTVDNRGLDGQMAWHAIGGSYGSIDYNQNKIYVIAWGTNEALQGIADAQYRGDINHILVQLKGKKVVIESPPLLTNPQNDAPTTVVRFRAILRELGVTHAVPVVDSVLRQDTWDGGGIHPSSEHYDERAKALAAAILKL